MDLLKIAKEEAVKKLQTVTDAKLSVIKKPYSNCEIETWFVQVNQAVLHKTDPSAPVPFLMSAKLDDETVTEYANSILNKYHLYATATGDVIKWRRKIQKTIESCSTVEQVKGVSYE